MKTSNITIESKMVHRLQRGFITYMGQQDLWDEFCLEFKKHNHCSFTWDVLMQHDTLYDIAEIINMTLYWVMTKKGHSFWQNVSSKWCNRAYEIAHKYKRLTN